MIVGRCRPSGLIHWSPDGRSAYCGRTLRLGEAAGTIPTCRSCLWQAQRATGVVYLICFDSPFGHARHYMGWTQDLHNRLFHHRNGTGANLIKHVQAAGITWTLTGLWPGTRNDERRMKNHGHGRRCLRCRAVVEEVA